MKSFKIVSVLLLALVAYSCVKQEQKSFPDEPRIYYQGVNNKTINFRDSASRLKVYFKFEDGDGDLARTASDNIFIRQFRSDTVFGTTSMYQMPLIAEDLRQGDWLEGDVTIDFPPGTIVPRPDSFHFSILKDTMVVEISIKDDAGNRSNAIFTDTIYIGE